MLQLFLPMVGRTWKLNKRIRIPLEKCSKGIFLVKKVVLG